MKSWWLDFGHGGNDPGAVGPNGLKESEVVLAVGLETAELLEAAGVKVGLSREKDVFVSLSKRAVMANAFKAQGFTSIHKNSAESYSAQGIETWIARASTVSYPLADEHQERMTSAFPTLADRGVRRANFTVLTETEMQADLVELAFIHNVAGEALLADKMNQSLYAHALAQGILSRLGILSAPPTSAVVEDTPEPVIHACDTNLSRFREIKHLSWKIEELAKEGGA